MSSTLIAMGSYNPAKTLTNADLEKMLDTSDEWLTTRTGIKERRIASGDEYTSDLAIAAVRDLEQKYHEYFCGIDLIVTASMTPDYYCPNISSLIQAEFGLSSCGAIDLNCACSGFVYGLIVANGIISSRMARKVLVIGADAMSKILDYSDRSTCVLFGDGAGAAILEYSETSDFIGSYMNTNGADANALYCTGLSDKIGDIKGYITQDGRKVYKWAVTNIQNGVTTLLSNANYTANDIDWFIPHSANQRIIDLASENSGLDSSKVLSTIAYYGNTSSASIPLTMSLNISNGNIKNGDTVLLYGFGGGLSQAGVIMKLNSIT